MRTDDASGRIPPSKKPLTCRLGTRSLLAHYCEVPRHPAQWANPPQQERVDAVGRFEEARVLILALDHELPVAVFRRLDPVDQPEPDEDQQRAEPEAARLDVAEARLHRFEVADPQRVLVRGAHPA